MWGLLFGKNKKTTKRFTKQRRAQAQQAQRKLFFEGLEERRVLATATVLSSNGNLTITGDNTGDNLTIAVIAPNLVNVTGTGGTSLLPAFNGNYVVTGNLTVNLGSGNDNVTFTGGGSLNGDVTVNLGDGTNSVSKTDTAMITLLGGHDFKITGGTGFDSETLNAINSRGLSVQNGAGQETVVLANTAPITTTGALTLTNGPSAAAQSVILGSVANAVTVGGNLQIVEGAGASSYTETLNNYHVAGPISIQNGNGAGGATATVTLTEPALATANGGTLDVYNGNNSVNTITVRNGSFGGYIALRNGSASGAAGNLIQVDGVTANNSSVNLGNTSSFNNGYSGNNQILLGESSSVAFNGFLAANAPVVGGVNNIQWGAGTSVGAVTLVNGPGVAPPTAKTNTIITGDRFAISITGNLTVVNANATVSDTATLNSARGPLTVTGNVSVNNGATATTNVSLGNALNLSVINGSLTIIDAATTAATNVMVNKVNVGPVIGPPPMNGNVSIANAGGPGADTVTIGNAGPVNIAGSLTINQGPGASAYTVNVTNYSAGGAIYIQNGAGTGAAAVALNKAPNVTNNGGGLTVTNGDNASNSITVNGGTFAAALKLLNGAASGGNNLIQLDGVTETTTAGNSFTNGPASANDIVRLGVISLVTLADATALNNTGAGANNLIDLAHATIHGNASLTNGGNLGTALSNTVNVTDFGAVTIDGGGNLKISNASATGSNAVGLGSFISALNVDGNVSVTNGTSGVVTLVNVGNTTATSTFGGKLTITDEAATLGKTVQLEKLSLGSVAITNTGAGTNAVIVGVVGSPVTISGDLNIVSSSLVTAADSTINLGPVTVSGNTSYLALGNGVDMVRLFNGFMANNAGSYVRIETGGGNDVVNIGNGSGAKLNALYVNLGAGDDKLEIDATASGNFGASGVDAFFLDGGNGNDILNISKTAVPDIASLNPVLLAMAFNNIVNFETINVTA